MLKPYSILLVDDDPIILKTLGHILTTNGYIVKSVSTASAALEAFAANHFDIVLTDLVLDDKDGIEILKYVKSVNIDTIVVILTAYGNMTSAIEALRQDADDFLLKPCEPEELLFRLKRCIEKIEFRIKISMYEKILPICCECKKIRDDTGKDKGNGDWLSVEQYLWRRVKMKSSHTYCPECGNRFISKLAK